MTPSRRDASRIHRRVVFTRQGCWVLGVVGCCWVGMLLLLLLLVWLLVWMVVQKVDCCRCGYRGGHGACVDVVVVESTLVVCGFVLSSTPSKSRLFFSLPHRCLRRPL